MSKKKITKQKPGEDRHKTDFSTSVSFHEEENDKPCSASYCHRAIVYDPKDIKQKLMIAANIVLECKEDKNRIRSGKHVDGKLDAYIQRLQKYTNLPANELKELNITRDSSFQKALQDVKTICSPTLDFLCGDIRNIFVKYIIEEKSWPTTTIFSKDLKRRTNKYIYETITIQRLVKNKLIKYQHFAKLNRYIILEHPEKIYQRTVYLKNVIEHRKQNRNFVYVEVKRIIPRSSTSGFIVGLAAFPCINKLEKFFTKDSADLIAKKWLQQRVLPLVPAGSIILICQPKRRKQISPSAKKSDIITWLDENGIPYENTHLAELYTLYMKFKDKVKALDIYDHVFLNAGFELIHVPPEWTILNFFRYVWADIEVMDAYYTGKQEAVKQKILVATQAMSTLNEAEEKLIKDEVNILEEDSIMEQTIENMLQMIQNGEVPLPEFPEELGGDKRDNFEMHVSDIIFDSVME